MSRALLYFCVVMSVGLASTLVPTKDWLIPQVAMWSFAVGFIYSRFDAKKSTPRNEFPRVQLSKTLPHPESKKRATAISV